MKFYITTHNLKTPADATFTIIKIIKGKNYLNVLITLPITY